MSVTSGGLLRLWQTGRLPGQSVTCRQKNAKILFEHLGKLFDWTASRAVGSIKKRG